MDPTHADRLVPETRDRHGRRIRLLHVARFTLDGHGQPLVHGEWLDDHGVKATGQVPTGDIALPRAAVTA